MSHKFEKIRHEGKFARANFPEENEYYECKACGMLAFRFRGRSSTKYISSRCGAVAMEDNFRRRKAEEISCDEWIIREIIE